MRKFLFSLCLISTGYCYAACDYSPAGATCNDTSVDNLNAAGIVVLKKTTVARKTSISGTVDSYATNLNTVDIRGKAKLVDTKVASEFKIKGYLEAIDSDFIGPVIINANKAMFNNSHIGSSIAMSADAPKSKLVLSGTTSIQGDINFSNGNGEVFLGPNAKVTGKVTGGRIVKEGEE